MTYRDIRLIGDADELPEVLSDADICEFLAIKRREWRRWRADGLTPPTVVRVESPHDALTRLTDFTRWLDDHTVEF